MRLSDIKKMEMGPDRVIRGFTPKFRKLDADWDDYIEALVEMEDMGKFAKVEGEALYHSHGTPGFEWIQDQYFERRLFDAIEAYHTTCGEGFFNTMYSGTSAVCHRLADLGELMNINQGLLNALQVSTPELEHLINLSRDAGALGAKLTGGGGGGAMLALAADAEGAQTIKERLERGGFEAHALTIGDTQ